MNADRNQTTFRSPLTYEAPRIVHRGDLKQFAGSPLSKDPANPLDLLSGK